MNTFTIYISVNDEEYISKMICYGNHLWLEAPIERLGETVYPVTVDGYTMYFDEHISLIYCNGEHVYEYEYMDEIKFLQIA